MNFTKLVILVHCYLYRL